jgi:hypothetical protein
MWKTLCENVEKIKKKKKKNENYLFSLRRKFFEK